MQWSSHGPRATKLMFLVALLLLVSGCEGAEELYAIRDGRAAGTTHHSEAVVDTAAARGGADESTEGGDGADPTTREAGETQSDLDGEAAPSADPGASPPNDVQSATPDTNAQTSVAQPEGAPRPADAVAVKPTCRTDGAPDGTDVRSGWPSDATTGPEVAGHDEDLLSPSGSSGRWVLDEDGQVVDAVYHRGTIEVRADDVMISNSVICGTGSHIILNRGRNLRILNSIVRGERGTVSDASSGSPCQSAVGYGDYTIRSSELTGCNDGVKAKGVTEIYDSWFHDNYTNRFGSGAGTHNDTVQSVNSPMSRLVFQGNSAYQDPCTSNRHFQLAPTEPQPPIGVLRIVDNFFYGINGVNLDRGSRAVDGHLSGNTFAGSASRGPFNRLLFAGDGMSSIDVTDNVYETGEPANTNPGTDYQCATE